MYRKNAEGIFSFILPELERRYIKMKRQCALHSLAWLASPIRAVLALRVAALLPCCPKACFATLVLPENRARAQFTLSSYYKKRKTKLSTIHCQLLRYAQCVQKTEQTRSRETIVSQSAEAMPLPRSREGEEPLRSGAGLNKPCFSER